MASVSLGVSLPKNIGMPPSPNKNEEAHMDYRQLLLNVKIQPRFLGLNTDMNTSIYLFTSTAAMAEYSGILSGAFGINSSIFHGKELNVYALNEGAISDGISNSYGPSFMGSAMGWYNSSTIPEMVRLGVANKALGAAGNLLGSGITDYIKGKVEEAKAAFPVLSTYMTGLALGRRIDLPNIWQGASSNMSYSITVRLYNPDPNDLQSYETYILAPLVAFLVLGTPISSSGLFYDRPFIARVSCPGLWTIKEAAITNVAVTKGGDNNDISFKQKPNSVDVRISFESIYPTMITQSNVGMSSAGSPTESLESLASATGTTVAAIKTFRDEENGQAANFSNKDSGPPTLNEYISNLMDEKSLNLAGSSNTMSTTKTTQAITSEEVVTPREDTTKQSELVDLQGNTPPFIKSEEGTLG